MRVCLLGPVSAETDAAPLRLGGRKQRAVFALLALQVNHPVALDRLVHEVQARQLARGAREAADASGEQTLGTRLQDVALRLLA